MEQRALEESRGQLSAILINLPEPVVVVDMAVQPVLTNAAYDLLAAGVDLERRMRNSSGQPLHPWETPLARAARGESFAMDLVILTESGEPRRFEAVGRPVRGEGGRGIVVLHDVTERTLLLLGQEFISLATHELRTPLTAVSAYIELLHAMLTRQGTDDPATHIAQQALTAVRRLSDRIADLADVQSLQSGKLRLTMERTDLAEVVAQVVEVAQVLARDQRIVLERTPGPLMATVDPRRIEQVLTNILTNAIRYAPGTERIDVRLRRAQDHAEIQVEDYGPGIPAEDLPKIFSRFFQVERTSTQAHQGLGLGLYLAKEIVDAHGGTIAVGSIEGKGTLFTITLPLDDADD